MSNRLAVITSQEYRGQEYHFKRIPCKYIGCETRQIRSQAKTRKQINEFHQAIDMPLLFPQSQHKKKYCHNMNKAKRPHKHIACTIIKNI